MPWPPPFRSLPNPRAVFAWGVYDLANQSFQLLINTLLFSLFVEEVLVTEPGKGAALWGMMAAASLVGIVLLSPIVGAIADERAWKREMLIASGVVCATLTCLLAVLQPGQVWLGFVLYLVAAVACGLGENFLGSFLPEISTPATVGRVSAIGWTMSYVGALALLGITAAYAFGLGRPDVAQARPMFVFAGLWFFLGMLPLIFWLRELATPARSGIGLGAVMAGAFGRLVASAKDTTKYRHLARFYLAFFVYSIGTMTVIYFLGLIGKDLAFELPQLILMALVVALTAGVSSALVGRVQDRLGHKRTISVMLACWVAATLAMAGANWLGLPVGFFWVVAGLIGFALGGLGTASRAMVGAFTPGRPGRGVLRDLGHGLQTGRHLRGHRLRPGEIRLGDARRPLRAGRVLRGRAAAPATGRREGGGGGNRGTRRHAGHPSEPPARIGLTMIQPAPTSATPPPKLSAVPNEAGRFGAFGGTYVPETLVAALKQLDDLYTQVCGDKQFWDRLAELNRSFVGRPTPLFEAKGLARRARSMADNKDLGASIWLKREDLAHTGAHKINNTLGQGLLAKRWARSASSPRPAPGSTAWPPRPPPPTSGSSAMSTWARRTSGVSLNVIRMRMLGAGSSRSSPARAPSRTPPTRRCATGWARSNTPTTSSARSSAPTPSP
jgi:UMF1 family MFS transporter